MTVLLLSLRLLLFIAVGFLARKTGVMNEEFDRMLSRFIMAIPLPCMIVDSFHITYSVSNLLKAPVLALLSVGSMAVVFVLVFLCTARMKDPALKKTVRFCLLFTNFTFVGLSVVREVGGSEGIFAYVLFTLPIRVVFYGGASVMLGKGGEKIQVKETIRRFLCEPVIAVFLGLFLYACQIDLPELLDSAIATLGNMASPLGLMLCGATIAESDWRAALRTPAVLPVVLFRLAVVPAAVVGGLLLLGVDGEMIRTSVYYYAMPVASLTPAFLLRYDPEAVQARLVAGYAVVLSTLLCVATIPLWTLVMAALS